MLEKLIFLYGEEKGKIASEKLEGIINDAKSKIVCDDRPFWDEKDVFLITYADSFQEIDSGRAPSSLARMTPKPTLKTLAKFLDVHLKGVIGGVHILPFYPYSSDRGFSIIDYYKVKPEFGNWENVKEISNKYRLMTDLVLNHVSVKHEWFQRFLAGDPKYEDYFIWFKKEEIPHGALRKVFRPRATPLLTPFETSKGERWVWTTFSVEDSTDQVDLNYKNPEVLLEIVNIILFLLEKGIRLFRLDSIPYIWKEIGTNCKSLPQAHTIVSIFREVLDLVCETALIVSQSSVSFEENQTYFGNKDRESNLIYNFALPPLVIEAFYSQKSQHLNELASKMKPPREDTAFFNILAVHDGIGVNGAKGFLSDLESRNLYQKIEEHGGKLSYRNLPNGNKEVIELNTSWWSAINKKDSESFDLQLRKFLTTHAVLFSLVGIPAVYYLSLFGQQNDLDLFSQTGIRRDINRTNYSLKEIGMKLSDNKAKEAKVFRALSNLIKKRKSFKAFHPNARQEVLSLDKRVFAVLRGENKEQVLALHNLSNDKIDLKFNNKVFSLEPYSFFWE